MIQDHIGAASSRGKLDLPRSVRAVGGHNLSNSLEAKLASPGGMSSGGHTAEPLYIVDRLGISNVLGGGLATQRE